VRHDRRQPHLQALDVAAMRSDAAGRQADDDAPALLPTGGVVDDERLIAEVDGHRDSRVRDHLEVEGFRGSIVEIRPC
jgi:hypothetical protein